MRVSVGLFTVHPFLLIFFFLTFLCTVPTIGTPGTGSVKSKLCYRVYLQLL